VPLVTHNTAYGQSSGAGGIGQDSSLIGRAAASGKPDVHTSGSRRGNGLGRINRDGHPSRQRNNFAELLDVQRFVRQQQIVAKACLDHSCHFRQRGAGERGVTVGSKLAGKLGALERLHMWPEAQPWKDLGHGIDVHGEGLGVDHQAWCLLLRRLIFECGHTLDRSLWLASTAG